MPGSGWRRALLCLRVAARLQIAALVGAATLPTPAPAQVPADTAAVIGAVAAHISEGYARFAEAKPREHFTVAVVSRKTPPAIERAFLARLQLPPRPSRTDVRESRVEYVIDWPSFLGDSVMVELVRKLMGPPGEAGGAKGFYSRTTEKYVLRRVGGSWQVARRWATEIQDGTYEVVGQVP
ncbi:MAG TPA: hypothetical protein VFS05_14825 [Gemmatimonadaceae bacterium]|nr:hypothetical protein [Gemmatimonadaceae bacterium]